MWERLGIDYGFLANCNIHYAYNISGIYLGDWKYSNDTTIIPKQNITLGATEEITRLQSHIVQFKNIITNEYPVGKKLDFLSQEIHRELNTIASKSSKQEIIATVVESKAESDRIREQVQNII